MTTVIASTSIPDLTTSWIGISSIIIFIIAYITVISEEFLHLCKSKPVMVAAGLIWILVGIAFAQQGDTTSAANAVRHNILEFTEIMLFLLAAITYINTLEERRVFKALRAWLINRDFSLYKIFWITGL